MSDKEIEKENNFEVDGVSIDGLSRIEELESLVNEQESIIEELRSSERKLRNDWAFALAEQKRLSDKMPEHIEERVKYFVNNFALSVLEIVDNLELALKAAESDKNIHMGLQMIYKKVLLLLENRGITQQKVDAGDMFDSHKHEIVEEVKSDYETNKIVEVKCNGYMMNGEVLRHAKVSVASGS